MPEPFVAPSQSVSWNDENGRHCHMSLGGPVLEIVASGKLFAFEMHNYFGPQMVTPQRHEPTDADLPKAFWDAFERWELGGKIVEGIRCVPPSWCRMCDGDGYILGEKVRIDRKLCSEAVTCPVCDGKKIETDSEKNLELGK